jgi:hypothetical protein
LEIEARSVPSEEALALHAEDVGHLQGGLGHCLCFRRER